jgi:hypothetical protein
MNTYAASLARQGVAIHCHKRPAASYNAECLIGTSATTAQSNFGADHPLYKAISTPAMLPALDYLICASAAAP